MGKSICNTNSKDLTHYNLYVYIYICIIHIYVMVSLPEKICKKKNCELAIYKKGKAEVNKMKLTSLVL